MSDSPPAFCVRFRAAGAVQGVGFRPFVYRLATELELAGFVRNDPAGATIELIGPACMLALFEQRLQRELPPPARVERWWCESRAPAPTTAGPFRIERSGEAGARCAAVLPDLALCTDCLRELRDPANRRFRHPFISCTRCGPRFSIITGIPYDRPATTLASFPLCDRCRAEYEDPADRRFHAQPISCPDCGPQLSWWGADGAPVTARDAALAAAADAIRAGQIVAAKGLGGFHLLCDARNEEAVATLRARKHREAKPLAVMVSEIAQARALCEINAAEENLLETAAAPIVLLRRRRAPGLALASGLAPGNPSLGLMLPYTPLHRLLLDRLGFPVVATSGNRSDEPICTDEHEAVERLSGLADGFLVHDRPIARPVEDSVARLAAGRPLLLRRARGYAPGAIPCAGPSAGVVVAVGAHLKSTIAVRRGDEVVLSAHLGDLDSAEARAAFGRALQDLPTLYDARPDRVVCDLHPDYASTRAAESSGLPIHRVQHHHAHIAAVLAEHGVEEEALGVSWDGTGYGSDGTIWGGEFLLSTRRAFTRLGHLRTFRLPGGDAAAREPRRAALGLLHELEPGSSRARAWFTPPEFSLLSQALDAGVNAPHTSSMGRLFDAVAALLGVRLRSRFEGEAAMELEWLADGVQPDHGYDFIWRGGQLDWGPAVRALMADAARGAPSALISARFHQGLVEAVLAAARAAGRRCVALGGGCFQNVRLLESCVESLRAAGFSPLWSARLPPGDGAISYGQAAAAP